MYAQVFRGKSLLHPLEHMPIELMNACECRAIHAVCFASCIAGKKQRLAVHLSLGPSLQPALWLAMLVHTVDNLCHFYKGGAGFSTLGCAKLLHCPDVM